MTIDGYFDGYDKKYPKLILELLHYFSLSNETDGNPGERSVMNFCGKHLVEIEGKKKHKYQPIIIDRICRKLCDKGYLQGLNISDCMGLHNNYMFTDNINKYNLETITNHMNSIVYGFEYVYNTYKDWVIPLIGAEDNQTTVGTGFRYSTGIVTAKHCVSDVDQLSIKGYTAEQLKKAVVYVSDNENLDIAFIDLNEKENAVVLAEGKIMDEILTMGYPQIPTFTGFLTAEKATISSKAEARITPTKGTIAAIGKQYMMKIDAYLITAKIRGGNSGGPVINACGQVVGIACQIPNYDEDSEKYDDLGYGVAIPSEYIEEVVVGKARMMQLGEEFFTDYDE